MPAEACAPCSEQKLRCDRRVSGCSNCKRSQTPCPGYRIKLSWPGPKNEKRSVLGPEPRGICRRGRGRPIGAVRWVNVRSADVKAHHELAVVHSIRDKEQRFASRYRCEPFLPSLSWIPTKLDGSDYSLLQYFQTSAASAITCDFGTPALLGIITRLAFKDDAPSSQAVLYATLAVSSLLHNGADTNTLRLEGLALRALEKSSKAGITEASVAQHVTAGMLLCSFEIHGKFRNSSPWYVHVNGAKQLIKASRLNKYTLSNEFVGVTNWVYHHDVSAQFGRRHWRKVESPMTELAKRSEQAFLRDNTKAMTAIVQDISKITGSFLPTHIILWPLADVFQNIVDATHPMYHSVKYRRELDALEYELESIFNGKHVEEDNRVDLSDVKSPSKREIAVLEIYRLATLIYLERASRNFSGSSPKLTAWANQAFDLLARLETCRHAFPIFIVACEARTDEQKIIIIDCLENSTRNGKPVLGFSAVRDMVQTAWALEDLETEQEVDYLAKMDIVVSGCDIMPSFA